MNSMSLYLLIGMLTALAKIALDDDWWRVLSGTVQYVPAFMVTPRLILSLRQLYARDLQGRRGDDIDTAFGLTSTADYGAVTSGLTFVNAGQEDSGEFGGEAQGEEIQLEERVSRVASNDSSRC